MKQKNCKQGSMTSDSDQQRSLPFKRFDALNMSYPPHKQKSKNNINSSKKFDSSKMGYNSPEMKLKKNQKAFESPEPKKTNFSLNLVSAQQKIQTPTKKLIQQTQQRKKFDVSKFEQPEIISLYDLLCKIEVTYKKKGDAAQNSSQKQSEYEYNKKIQGIYIQRVKKCILKRQVLYEIKLKFQPYIILRHLSCPFARQMMKWIGQNIEQVYHWVEKNDDRNQFHSKKQFFFLAFAVGKNGQSLRNIVNSCNYLQNLKDNEQDIKDLIIDRANSQILVKRIDLKFDQ